MSYSPKRIPEMLTPDRTGGSLLYATGMVDERTMDKLKREAKEAGTESWYLSWALDLTKEERSQGVSTILSNIFRIGQS